MLPRRTRSRSGQSLLDVLIASALGALLLVGSLSLLAPSLKGSSAAERAQDAAAMARGLMDSVRSLAASSWNVLAALDDDTPYYLQRTVEGTSVVPGIETVSGGEPAGLASRFTLDDTNTKSLKNSVPGAQDGSSDGPFSEISPATEPEYVPSCPVGGCWSFVGASAFSVPDGPELNPEAITIAGWFKIGHPGRIPVSKEGQYRLLAGDVDSAHLALRYATDATSWGDGTVVGNTELVPDTWYHLAATYDGAQWLLYVDGSPDGSRAETGTLSPSNSELVIGDYTSVGSGYAYDGSIDDLRIYGRALSPSEIRQLYTGLNGGMIFNRWFSVGEVRRNGAGAVVPSGGTVDPSTLAVTVGLSGPGVATRTMATYVTRSFSRALYQTDWSGGPGQGVVTSPGNRFGTSTAIDYLTTTGSAVADLPNLISEGGGGNGGISSTTADHFAWNDVIGWINFYSSGTVQLTSQRLKGYANSVAGEISLDCATSPAGNICGSSNYHVDNNGAGVLSGFAWNDTYGWISFNCSNNDACATSNYSVTVNPTTGVFSGFAWNDIIGWISFNGVDIGIPTYRVVAAWSAAAGYGVLDSGTIGFDSPSQPNGITWTGTKPSGTDARFQIAISNGAFGPWTYVGPDGTASSYYAPEPGESSPLMPWNHPAGSYLRYRMFLVSNVAQSASPRVDSLVIRWSP